MCGWNVGGGVRSHPAVTDIEMQTWRRGSERWNKGEFSFQKETLERGRERQWGGRYRALFPSLPLPSSHPKGIKRSPFPSANTNSRHTRNTEAKVSLKCHQSQQLECRQGQSRNVSLTSRPLQSTFSISVIICSPRTSTSPTLVRTDELNIWPNLYFTRRSSRAYFVWDCFTSSVQILSTALFFKQYIVLLASDCENITKGRHKTYF